MRPTSRPRPSRAPRRALRAAATTSAVTALLTAAAVGTPATAADEITSIVDGMSVDELIGQMTWTHVHGATADEDSGENRSRYGVGTPAEVVETYHLGGVLYFAWAGNTEDPAQVAELSAGLQQAAQSTGTGIPLAVTVDQEGGTVSRIGPPATALPGGMALGATADTGLARAQGDVLGSELAAMGINVDFAPVVDLNTNPANPVIGLRSMGEDAALVGQLSAAQIEGLQSQHVAAAAKHFPGHGDTDVDSHTGLPVIAGDPESLERHLEPFRAAVDAGVDIIMSAHIVVESIDPELPGTLSPAVLTDLLRGELGYDGLVTTDALDMDALKQLPGNPLDDADIAALAVQAGSDILLEPPDLDAAFAGIHAALDAGDLTRERLEESVTRILEWKVERGIWQPGAGAPERPPLDVVGSDEHRATATTIAERATTLLRNEGGIVPLDPAGTSLLVAGAGSAWPERLTPLLREQGFTVEERLESGDSPTAGYRSAVAAAAGETDAVVVVVDDARGTTAQQQLVAEVAAGPTPVVVVLAGTPYDLAATDDDAAAVVASYGSASVNFEGIAAVLGGAVAPTGQLPVSVPGPDGSTLAEAGFGLRTTTEVTPAAVEFTDEPGAGADTLTVPAVDGVSYLLDGSPVEPGTHPATGAVAVTAEADDGFHLAAGATVEWSHDFGPSTSATPAPDDGSAADDAAAGWLLAGAAVVLVAAAGAVVVLRRRPSQGGGQARDHG
ncbi:glycoside hydrolase family 3 N-terminal domain-containing protein [Georgenia sp. MJ173]|uniref:glycoside hydrolase family 3 protein n=1 Tax=Georgenia sunbinii TaxID=3117728 RepID=UPI002F26D02E